MQGLAELQQRLDAKMTWLHELRRLVAAGTEGADEQNNQIQRLRARYLQQIADLTAKVEQLDSDLGRAPQLLADTEKEIARIRVEMSVVKSSQKAAQLITMQREIAELKKQAGLK